MIVYVKTKASPEVIKFNEVREVEEFIDTYVINFTADATFEGRIKIWKDKLDAIYCEM